MIKLFSGQRPQEKVYIITRRHWIKFAVKLLFWLVFVAILIGFDWYIVPQFPTLGAGPSAQVISLIKTVYVMYLTAGLFLIWLIYYLNYQVVTNERVVDVDQRGLLHHAVSELHLSQIEDVTADTKGVLGNLFNYGTVYIQTAGAAKQFEMEYIPDPEQTAKLILSLSQKFVQQPKG